MDRRLYIKRNEQELSEEVKKAGGQYPVFMRDRVRVAFQAAEDGEYKKAEELCCELLDYKPVPEICELLGVCYFAEGNMPAAQSVFSDLTYDHPEEEKYYIYLGITHHALGKYEEAVKELGRLYPLKEYYPFYNTTYGDSLLQIGSLEQSRAVFREETAFFEKTGKIMSPEMLDGAFQNLLYLDITLGNGKYPEDIALYYDFLNQTEMTEKMQKYLAGNIVYFSDLMKNKWYRPLFLEFISFVRDKGFLTNEEPLFTLSSAFSSWESYAYHEDGQISALMETYLEACHERKYMEADFFTEEETDAIQIKALAYEWYMCQYAAEHMAEIDYVKDKYPYSYKDNEEFLEKIRTDAEKTAEKLLNELYERAGNIPRPKFEESMHHAYKKACEEEKEPVYVCDGMETFKRIQPKVGRNDPCPCGSGKKYKKCCGK